MNDGGAEPPTAKASTAAYLRTPEAVRERCERLFAIAAAGELAQFSLAMGELPKVVDYVLGVINAQYPTLAIPVHSRWRHFDVGGVNRCAELAAALAALSPTDCAAAQVDLAVTSVLLDAGAGADWTYCEQSSGLPFKRSEGLAVASYRMFRAGAFSSDRGDPLRADSAGLAAITDEALAAGFQATPENPLVGVPGRASLMRALALAVRANAELFGQENPRPGGLVSYFRRLADAHHGEVRAAAILDAVLRGFASIWPGRIAVDGENLGDVWPHSALGVSGSADALVPFHKLSQWLTYSLVEPLEGAGMTITGLEALTGLPEYRNGGLFIDLGVIVPKDPHFLRQSHAPGDEAIVAWRALTVALLDRVGEAVRARLGKTEDAFPLAKVLEGGTWAAGRKIAAELRPFGPPPVSIESDGTVF